MTDAAGRFAIDDAREGELHIRIQHPELYDPAAATRGPIVIGAEDLELEPIELAPGGVVEVTLEGWGAPKPGVHFCVDAIGRAPRERPEVRPIGTAVIDPQGLCRITGLPPGPYDLQFRPLGAAPAGFTHGPQPLGAVTVGERQTVELNGEPPPRRADRPSPAGPGHRTHSRAAVYARKSVQILLLDPRLRYDAGPLDVSAGGNPNAKNKRTLHGRLAT